MSQNEEFAPMQSQMLEKPTENYNKGTQTKIMKHNEEKK